MKIKTLIIYGAAKAQMDNIRPEILDEDFEVGFFVATFKEWKLLWARSIKKNK